MIELNGHLVEDISVWGWPWHGVLESEPTAGGSQFNWYLRRADGGRVLLQRNEPPFYDRFPVDLMNSLRADQENSTISGGVTHQVRVPGHVMTPRTPEQLAYDLAQGHEWCSAAMLGTRSHRTYSKQLGEASWIYTGNGERWLLSLVYNTVPRPGPSPSANLSLTIRAVPLGQLGVPAQSPVVVGTVSAPTCIDAAEYASVLTHFGWSPAVIQSIRSDGGELVIEIQRSLPRPSLRDIGAVGYYRLGVSKSGATWSFELEILKRSSELYTKSVTGSLVQQRVGVIHVLTSEPEPGEDGPFVYEPQVVDTSGINFLTADGLIEQVAEAVYGYVYDEDDVRREVRSRLRIVHDCDVPAPDPQVGGQRLEWHPSDSPPTYDLSDPITIEFTVTPTVTSTLTAEVLLDGAVQSSTSVVMTNSATIHYSDAQDHMGPSGPASTRSASWNESGTLTIGGYAIGLNYSRSVSDNGILWPGNWPVYNGIYGWCSVAGNGALTPWPGAHHDTRAFRGILIPQPQGGLGALPLITRVGILGGAVRLANNVYAPCFTAGGVSSSSGGAISNWNRESTAGAVSNGIFIPATQLGRPVGPAGGEGDGLSFGNTDRKFLTPVEFDYLHARLVEGGGVI